MKKIFKKLFHIADSKRKNTFTIINENRKTQTNYRIYLVNKNERQDNCLSRYFENLKGLNLIERNIYSKTF